MEESASADMSNTKREHKLFISHASKDREFILALIELFEGIGMREGSIVCSSIPGYGIPSGAQIYDWLREQFLLCDLRVLFVLSQNYYKSAACLNEMGAAWVTRASDTLILLPGFTFSDIRGCIDSVSYTHLDVYKRQEQRGIMHVSRKLIQMWNISIAGRC